MFQALGVLCRPHVPTLQISLSIIMKNQIHMSGAVLNNYDAANIEFINLRQQY